MSRSKTGVWKDGTPEGWAEARAFVLRRDRRQCQLKTKRCTGTATCVHHVHGADGPLTDPRFLVASCQPCNQLVGDPRSAPDHGMRPPGFLTELLKKRGGQHDADPSAP